MEDGVPEKMVAEGIFVTSAVDGSHGGTSLLFILGVLPSPSGSGEDFLFRPRRCFLSEEDGGEKSAQTTGGLT